MVMVTSAARLGPDPARTGGGAFAPAAGARAAGTVTRSARAARTTVLTGSVRSAVGRGAARAVTGCGAGAGCHRVRTARAVLGPPPAAAETAAAAAVPAAARLSRSCSRSR